MRSTASSPPCTPCGSSSRISRSGGSSCAIPTASTPPPWWASEKQGLMGGRVKRVPPRVMRDLRGEPLEQDDVQGANPWASMPSNHFSTAAMTAMLVADIDRRAGAGAWAYALALGFALVYHGEHYV